MLPLEKHSMQALHQQIVLTYTESTNATLALKDGVDITYCHSVVSEQAQAERGGLTISLTINSLLSEVVTKSKQR